MRIFNRFLPVLLIGFSGIILFILSACNTEQEQLNLNPSKGLVFSADTIFFDTVFTELKTITLRIRVSNPNENAIRIKSVYVNGVNGQQPFSFSIKGRSGPQRVENVELEGLDSAYVLISARLDGRNQDNPFIIKDSLVFEVEGRSQKQDVKILAFGQDVQYLKNQTVPCNAVWTNDRPIILLDTVSIPRNCTLRIKEGTRVYGYNFAFLIVRGKLFIEGSRGKPVIFQGTRRESYYSDVPGQWGGILIMDGGKAVAEHLRLKNSYRGIQVGEVGPKGINVDRAELTISNSFIQNVVDYGILGLKSKISAVNNQFADCGEGGFAGYQGGVYQLWHNTFGYSGNNPFRRDGKFQLSFSDNFPDTRTQTLYVDTLKVKVINNLIAGTEDDEIAFGERKYPGVDFDTIFHHNLLKSNQDVFFGNTDRNKGNRRIPEGFRFLLPFEYDFAADTLGSAEIFGTGIPLNDAISNNQGILTDSDLRSILATDILGFTRPVEAGQSPDAGAYNNRKKKN